MPEELKPPSACGVSPDTQREIEQFLYYEADLLDRFALEEWFDLLAEDFSIRAPIRSYTHPGTEHPEFSEEGYYIKNGYTMVQERVTRLKKEYAWAENPRSRVRHVIGNVYITETGEEYNVTNNQHVYRSKGDTADNDTISAQRETTLRDTDDGFRIADRTVYLDDSIVSTDNITLPLL